MEFVERLILRLSVCEIFGHLEEVRCYIITHIFSPSKVGSKLRKSQIDDGKDQSFRIL